MLRTLYRCLIRLHPFSFRVRFQEELLSLFDEAESEWGTGFLVGDVAVSLVRRWSMNPLLWKWFIAGIGGLLLLVIAFGSFLPWDKPVNLRLVAHLTIH
jgi:hypothetical protein